MNFGLEVAELEMKLQLTKLEVIRVEAYKSSRMYKTREKLFHDKHIHKKEFFSSQKLLLYDSRLQLFLDKLRSR